MEMLYNLGEMLVRDDQADIGYTTYYHRTGHRYHGKKSKKHESMLHHYQAGLVLCLIAQIGGVLAQASEMHQDLNPHV